MRKTTTNEAINVFLEDVVESPPERKNKLFGTLLRMWILGSVSNGRRKKKQSWSRKNLANAEHSVGEEALCNNALP